MSKPAYIICSPWDEHTARAIRAPGATRDHCTVCRVAVALSPSAFLHALTASVLCFTCAMDRMRADGDAKIMPVSAAQLAELRAVGIDTTAKHLDRMAQVYLDRWVKKSS